MFVSGCSHHCKGCFNAETWDFNSGIPFTTETEKEIIKALSPEYISGLTLLGGDPVEPENQKALLHLLQTVHNIYPKKDIWCFTGYLFDKDIMHNFYQKSDITKKFFSYIDVLIDGPFIEELKDLRLKFKGSSNQRTIDIKKSIKNNKIILLE